MVLLLTLYSLPTAGKLTFNIMSLFSALFGSGSSYSTVQKSLSREQIRHIVSRSRIQTLSAQEEAAIEEAIDKRRLGDGRISVAQIDEVLGKLEQTGTISINDRKSVIKAFQGHFGVD